MKQYRIKNSKRTKFLEKKKPVARIEPASLVTMKISCCTDGYSLAGPIYVHGAKKGSSLKITVKDIRVERQGSCCGLCIPVRSNKAILDKHIAIGLKPNIGVLGVIPAKGKALATTPGNYGGNMDANDVQKGSVVYLPVWVDGAYLYVGDTHGVIGDGEVWGQGLEIGAEVVLLIEIEDRPWFDEPYAIKDGNLSIMTSGGYADGINTGLDKMTEFLQKRTTLSPNQAKALMSMAGTLGICQDVCPAKTFRFSVPMKYLRKVLLPPRPKRK